MNIHRLLLAFSIGLLAAHSVSAADLGLPPALHPAVNAVNGAGAGGAHVDLAGASSLMNHTFPAPTHPPVPEKRASLKALILNKDNTARQLLRLLKEPYYTRQTNEKIKQLFIQWQGYIATLTTHHAYNIITRQEEEVLLHLTLNSVKTDKRTK